MYFLSLKYQFQFNFTRVSLVLILIHNLKIFQLRLKKHALTFKRLLVATVFLYLCKHHHKRSLNIKTLIKLLIK